MLRIKALHDQVQAQATDLAEWNQTLEQRVSEQVAELDRMNRLKSFLSPQIAKLVVSSGDEKLLETHRRDVTVVFCDLRGFTAFAESAEPEDIIAVLQEYYRCLGEQIDRFEGTLEHFAGDGLLDHLQRSDPVPRSGAARGAHGGRDASAGRQRLPKNGAASAMSSASASASPRDTPHWATSATRAGSIIRRPARW